MVTLWNRTFLGVALLLLGWERFQYASEAFQQQQLQMQKSPYLTNNHERYRCIPFQVQSSTRSQFLTRQILTNSPLFSMKDSTNTDDSSEVLVKEGKRKRLKKTIRRLFSYPKEKIKTNLNKLRGGPNNTEEVSESTNVAKSKKDNINLHQTTKDASDGSDNVATDGSAQDAETKEAAAVEASTTATSINMGLGSNTSPVVSAADTAPTAVAVKDEEETIPLQTVMKEESASQNKLARRSATSANTDLSGKWFLLVDEDFKMEYDKYLNDLGQSALVRSVALSIIGMTIEEITQSENGRELCIRGRNVRGNWERTLRASTETDPVIVPIVTAGKEEVNSECWWEDNGRVHRSWLRGVNKYGGGDFESKRYLEGDDGRVLVCESIFHPRDKSKAKASVTWRFEKHE